jgi:hypothetical protein
MTRTKQFIDKQCKKCGARPTWYYEGKGFVRGTCADCDDAYRAAQWQRRANRQSHWDPPFKILDRACSKCGESPAWYKKHASAKDGYRGECVECRKAYFDSYRQRPGKREKSREYFKLHGPAEAQRTKIEVLSHYGGFCYCCGESDWRFLTLDHKFNNGAQHRRDTGAMGLNMYRWARKNLYPEIFQVACFNCNCARQFRANGICPHEEERMKLVA